METKILEKFLKIRKRNPKVWVTIEFTEHSVFCKIYKRKKGDNSPFQYPEDGVSFLHSNYPEGLILLEEKIGEIV